MKKLLIAALAATVLALSLSACSKNQEPAADPEAEVATGTLVISAECEGAPTSSIGLALVGPNNELELVTLDVNGETQSLDLASGRWIIRCVTAPATSDGVVIFKNLDSTSVRVKEGETTNHVVALSLIAGVDEATQVVEVEVGETAPSGNDATDTPSNNASGASGNATSGATSGNSGTSGTSASGNTSGGSTSGNSGSGGGSTGGNSGGSSTPSQPAHTHNWVWVSNWVTIYDSAEWDEITYRWATWCNLCNCEVSGDHNMEMGNQGQGGHTTGSRQVQTGVIHHEAATHQEDQGHYECSSCGAWQ